MTQRTQQRSHCDTLKELRSALLLLGDDIHHTSACYMLVCGWPVCGAVTLLFLVIQMAVSQSARKTLECGGMDAQVVHPFMEEAIVPWRQCGQDVAFLHSSADWW